jgi:hypothetical protein
MADIIQLRRDTEENWLKYNPILLEGEVGVIKGTIHYKIGDGIHNWSELPLGGVKSSEDITIQPDGTMQVVDDSHNHSIANVTGLQSALDEKASVEHNHGLLTKIGTNEVVLHAGNLVDSEAEGKTGWMYTLTKEELANGGGETLVFNAIRAVRAEVNANDCMQGSYAPTLLVSTSDTRFAMSVSHSLPVIKFFGGNGRLKELPDWNLTIKGYNGTAITLPSTSGQVALISQVDEKVDKVEGKGLSSNDYTTAEKDKLAGVAAGSEVNTIVAVQRNGTAITPKDRVVNILVPVKTSELNNDSTYQTAADVAETIIGVDLNIASGIITLTRKNGTTFTIDLPTEKIIKSGYYDSVSEEIVLVLADESEIRFNASQLIDEYYADESTLELYIDTADGNKKKFRLKTAYKNKIDGSEQTSNKTASVSSSSTETQYPTAKAVYNAVKDLATNVQTFTTASARANIESGETISTAFCKIRKWLADLKTVAFSGSYIDLSDKPTISNSKVVIKQKGVEKGSFSLNQSGDATVELTDDNTTYGIGNESTAGLVKSDANNVEILSSGKMIARKADLATYVDKGIKGIRIDRSSSSTKYVMLGAVGLDYNINSTFSLTVEVHGAYSGSGTDCNSRLSIYNIVFRLVNDSVAGQIGCVYASDSINNAIIGEIVYPSATTDGMLYLWVNVSDISTQEAFNICVYGDTNKIDIRQSVHTTSIPYYSGVLLNPKLCNSIITIGNITGLQNELNTKVAKIQLPTTGNTSAVYVKIATVNLTSTYSNTAQAIISGTGDFGGIVKDVAIVSICGRTTDGTQHIRLLKIDKASYNWTIGCGYVKGSNSVDFYLKLNKYNGYSSLIPISADGATFNTTLTVITTKPSGWVDGSVGSVYSDFNKPTFDITSEGTDAVTDNTLLLSSATSGIATTKAIYRRPVTLLWNYIKSKISSELGLSTSYSGVAKYSNDIRGNVRSRNNNSRYIEIGRISVPTAAYADRTVSLYIKGYHNSNLGDSYIFNVTLGTDANAAPYTRIYCVMASRTNYNEVLIGELTSTHLILYLDCVLQNYTGWGYSKLSDVSGRLQYTSGNVYVASIPANGGTKVSQSNKMLAIMDGNGNTITSYYAPKTELSKYLPLAGGTLTGAVTRTITNTKDTVIMPDKDGYGKLGGADNMFFKGYFNEVRVGTEIELDSGPRPNGDVEDGGRYYNNIISGGADGVTIKTNNLEVYQPKGTLSKRLNVLGVYKSKQYAIPAEGSSNSYTHRKMFTLHKNGGVRFTIFTTSWGPGTSGVAEYIIWVNNTSGQNNKNLNVINVGSSGSTMYPKFILNSDRSLVVYDEGSYYAYSYFYTLQPLTSETDFEIHTSESRSVVSGVNPL